MQPPNPLFIRRHFVSRLVRGVYGFFKASFFGLFSFGLSFFAKAAILLALYFGAKLGFHAIAHRVPPEGRDLFNRVTGLGFVMALGGLRAFFRPRLNPLEITWISLRLEQLLTILLGLIAVVQTYSWTQSGCATWTISFFLETNAHVSPTPPALTCGHRDILSIETVWLMLLITLLISPIPGLTKIRFISRQIDFKKFLFFAARSWMISLYLAVGVASLIGCPALLWRYRHSASTWGEQTWISFGGWVLMLIAYYFVNRAIQMAETELSDLDTAKPIRDAIKRLARRP